MPHPLVEQLRFTRREMIRCLDGLAPADAERRLPPNNSIAWIVGHMANHEQLLWLQREQGRVLVEGLHERVGWGQPASTPAFDEMRTAWERITAATEAYLEGLGEEDLLAHPIEADGQPHRENRGCALQRLVYHYWFHTGEIHALRQQMGHPELPSFIGQLGEEAPYRSA